MVASRSRSSLRGVSDKPDRRVLRSFLEHPARPAGTLTYHELQGFLFTVAAAPELILPSEWLPLIFGDQEAGYADLAEAQSILRHLMAAYNAIVSTTHQDRVGLLPGCRFRGDVLTNLDESAPISRWSRGFLTGQDWLENLWNVDLPEAVDEELAAVLMTLSFFASRGMAEGLRGELGSSRSLREMAEYNRRVFRTALTAYVRLGRELGEVIGQRGARAHVSIRAVTIGRNDPCPCGSGRKFKKCCGARVH